MFEFDKKRIKITVLGLGYVGLPLAIEFAKQLDVVGFDISESRVDELRSGNDSTLEVDLKTLSESTIKFTNFEDDIVESNVYIVSVPTPIDEFNKPNLKPLLSVSATIAGVLKEGDIVVYESTVYPGATEEKCVPVLEEVSGLKFNKDFFVGYSPERANPGDDKHKLKDIIKVISGSTEATADFVEYLYKLVATAGVHKASSIKVAEAAKIIENTQRDINIALMNELSIIFDKLGIDTQEVINAAATKWNFNRFTPGLVGGHCIGVDPYYLTHKAQEVGYHPEMILAGRRINDSMGSNITERLIKALTKKKINIVDAKILVLGLTFKENCPDLRNSKIIDIIDNLKEYNIFVDVHDPLANAEIAQKKYGVELINKLEQEFYDAVVLAVPHEKILSLGEEFIRGCGKHISVLFDIKSALNQKKYDHRL
jgi:UDP-N-acetyl-D-glucosamine/UDP-N-acetyl-D-galactosamine dehydrogenase